MCRIGTGINAQMPDDNSERDLNETTHTLPVYITETTDILLFGLDWCLQCGLKLWPGSKKNSYSKHAHTLARRSAEIERLVKEDVLEPIDTSMNSIEWTSPVGIAIKSNGIKWISGDIRKDIVMEGKDMHTKVTTIWCPSITSGWASRQKCLDIYDQIPCIVARYTYWSRIHTEFAWPYENKRWSIIVDGYIRWLGVIPAKNIIAEPTICALREVISRFELPKLLIIVHSRVRRFGTILWWEQFSTH